MVINIDEIEINLIDEIEEIKKIIKTLDGLEQISQRYLKYANVFEFVEWEDNVGAINCGIEIGNYKNEFLAHLSQLRNHLEKIYNYDTGKDKDVKKIQKILKNFAQFKNETNITQDKAKELIEIIDENFLLENYKQCLNNIFTKELNAKIQNIIVTDQLNCLEEEKCTIQSVKVNFFGRFTGKKKLKDLVLENIDLKKEAVMSQVNSYNSGNSIEQIINVLNDYIKNKNINNQNIAKLNNILENINNTKLMDVMDNCAINVNQTKRPKIYTLIKYNDKTISTKDKIQYFTKSNIELRKDNTKNRMKGITEQTKNELADYRNPISTFFNCINYNLGQEM